MSKIEVPESGKIIAHGISSRVVILPGSSPLIKLPILPKNKPGGTRGATKSVNEKNRLIKLLSKNKFFLKIQNKASAEITLTVLRGKTFLLAKLKKFQLDAEVIRRIVEKNIT